MRPAEAFGMPEFVCMVQSPAGAVRQVQVYAPNMASAMVQAARGGGLVLSAVPAWKADATTLLQDGGSVMPSSPVEASPTPNQESLTHKPLTVSAEALTPNSRRYVAVGLLKESRLKTVGLVVEKDSGRTLVAHQVHFPPSQSQDDARQRLEKVGKALARVKHPRVPPFVGYQSTATGHWLLFEYVEGFSLDAYESECQIVSDPWVVWWLHQILQMLAELHRQGIMVGGFVPRHFMVSERDLHLVHLGVVETLHPMALLQDPERLAFSAPEHTGAVLTVASDLYSAGAVAWWLAVGTPPVPGINLEITEVVAPVRALRPNFPYPALEVLTRLLQYNPADRYASADDAIAALAPCVPVMDEGMRPPEAPMKVRFFGDATIRKMETRAAEVERKAAVAPAPPNGPGKFQRPRAAESPDAQYEAVGSLHGSPWRHVVLLRAQETQQLVVGHHFTATAENPEAEARRLQGLTHPRMPRFLRWQTAADGPWFLFEYVPGFVLSCYQPDDAKENWIAFWLSELLGILEYLHGRKVWVGGLVPGDLVANSTGLYLVDHGSVSRLYPEASAMGRSGDRRAFMAPEERHSPRPTEQSDVFSAGAITYWLLTGDPPPSDRSPHPSQLIQAHPRLLPIVAEVVCGLLQVERARRLTARGALDRMALEVPSLSGKSPPEPQSTFQMQGFEGARIAAMAVTLAKARPPAEAEPPAEAPALPLDRPPAPIRASSAPRADLQEAIASIPGPAPPPRPARRPAPRPVPEDEPRYAAALRTARPFILPVVGLLLAVEILRMLFLSSAPALSSGKLMWVQTGPVAMSDDSSDWQVANSIHAPSFLRSLGDETSIGFGTHGLVSLRGSRAKLRLDRLSTDNVALALLDGSASLQVPSDGTVLLGLPEGQATCPAGSTIDLSWAEGKLTVRVLSGNINIHTWGGENRVETANSSWVSERKR